MKKYDELVTEATKILEHDNEIFGKVCEELDCWNGFLGDERLYNMCDFDDLMYGLKPSELLEKVGTDFDIRDDYFYFTIYGAESTSEEPAEHYRECFSFGEVFDELLENICHIDLVWIDSEFAELMESIANYEE